MHASVRLRPLDHQANDCSAFRQRTYAALTFTGIAYGWISCFDGLGMVAAMFVFRSMEVWRYFPDVIFLVLCASALVFGYLVIPETKFTALFDSLEQMDENIQHVDRKILAAPKSG